MSKLKEIPININDKNGIRGLSSGNIFGQKKITVNLESVMFSPLKIYGFNFVFYGFADLAFIGPEDISFLKLNAHSGIGFGLRIRNERLVFPTLQFRFAFYPNADEILFEDHFNFSGEKKLKPKDFITPPPQPLEYR